MDNPQLGLPKLQYQLMGDERQSLDVKYWLINIECLVIKVSGDYEQDWTCKIVVTVVSSEGIGQCDNTKHYNTSPRCEVSFDTNNLALNGKGRGQDPLHEGEEGYNMEYTSIRTDM